AWSRSANSSGMCSVTSMRAFCPVGRERDRLRIRRADIARAPPGRNVGFEHGVHPRLVAWPLGFEPLQDIAVHADGHWHFGLRHHQPRGPEPLFVQDWSGIRVRSNLRLDFLVRGFGYARPVNAAFVLTNLLGRTLY